MFSFARLPEGDVLLDKKQRDPHLILKRVKAGKALPDTDLGPFPTLIVVSPDGQAVGIVRHLWAERIPKSQIGVFSTETGKKAGGFEAEGGYPSCVLQGSSALLLTAKSSHDREASQWKRTLRVVDWRSGKLAWSRAVETIHDPPRERKAVPPKK